MRLVRVAPAPHSRQNPKKKTGRLLWLALVGLSGIVTFQLLRPLPASRVTLFDLDLPGAETASIAWPNTARAAIAASGYGILGRHGDMTPLASASTAKIITALCVLEKHPLELGESGPVITMTGRDVALYDLQVQQNGSSLPVKAGLQLSEYQALQALMIPSANNIADSLALWAFGNQPAYATYANDYLERHGVVHTRVGNDASGLDPSTVSTPEDLATLGLLARKNAVLMQIAGQKSATFPYAGEFENYNRALGLAGINGLKTGNNDENKGALAFTADILLGNKTVALSGAVTDASSLQDALDASVTLVTSVNDDFQTVTAARKGDKVGFVRTPWGQESAVRVHDDLTLLRWKEHAVTAKHTVKQARGTLAESVGALVIRAGEQQKSVTLTITNPSPGPGVWWKLTRLR